MFKIRRSIAILIAAALLLVIPASASATTLWATNEWAWRVPHSYKGSDWAGYISFGQSFELLETRNGYARLRNAKGNTAWAELEYVPLSETDPCTLDQMMVVQCDGDILWCHADYIEEPIPLKKGDIVHVVGVTPYKEWYRVEYNGSYYYALGKTLAETPAPEEGRVFVTVMRYYFAESSDLYSTTDETTAPIAYIPDGTPVYLLETTGRMVKIRTSEGVEGYTQTCNLTTLEDYLYLYPEGRVP